MAILMAVGIRPGRQARHVSLRDANQMAVIDTVTREVTGRIDVGRSPIQVHGTPDGHFVYVANQGTDDEPDDAVSVIDTASNTVVKTIRTGRGAHRVTVSCESGSLDVGRLGRPRRRASTSGDREGDDREYDRVERIGAANDKGRDVIGFLTRARHEGPWHLFQCKRKTRGGKLGKSEGLAELGKVFFHHCQGAYKTLPEKYVFVAPRGIVGSLMDLINNPSTLGTALIDGWDEHCSKSITRRETVALACIPRSPAGKVSFSSGGD